MVSVETYTISSNEGVDILEWKIPQRVLAILLKDHSTGKNIKWCTDDYSKARGAETGFEAGDEIRLEQLVNPDDQVIRPRVVKDKAEQRQRSIERAEVFTPSWICNQQNNLVDCAWFGTKTSPFNLEIKNGWRTKNAAIKFPTSRKALDYILANRLEITCGEAPYLASRYDTVSGAPIPVEDRIGLLDRKLRIVTEIVPGARPDIWMDFAKYALKSVYAYDWQGDNVFLARENLLWTVLEHLVAYTGAESAAISVNTMAELAEIISWNVWQMDGIKFVVPDTCGTVEEMPGIANPCQACKKNKPGLKMMHNGIHCRIMDWEAGQEVLFMPPFDFAPCEPKEPKS